MTEGVKQLTQINRSFIPNTLREQESDTVFRVPLRSDTEKDTLFLSVRETDAADLTKTDHPLGWILTVLLKEHADKEAISNALLEAISHINTLDDAQAKQRDNAIIYLLQLILHRRSAAEQQDLLTLIDQHTLGMEVETMAESIIEQSQRQGETRAKQDAVLKLLQIRFHEISQDISNRITSIHSISNLDSLFEKVATAQKLDDIDWNNFDD